MVKIVGNYQAHAFWFEIFECCRKIGLLGLPIAFEPGTLEQQLFGLLISFCSFGVFLSVKPFIERLDNHLEILCQLCIFLAMLGGIVTRGGGGVAPCALQLVAVALSSVTTLAVASSLAALARQAVSIISVMTERIRSQSTRSTKP